jgi:hypothetical protein
MIEKNPKEYIEEWRIEFSELLRNPSTHEEEIHQFLVMTSIFLPLHWPYQNKVFRSHFITF